MRRSSLALVTPISLDADAKEVFSATMRRGNECLRKWSEKLVGQRQSRKFRAKLFAGKIDTSRIPKEDLDAIFAVRVVQEEVFAAYVKIVYRCVSRLSYDGTYISADDLIEEGAIALLNAIYGYRTNQASFLTYATCVVRRHLSFVMVKNAHLSGVSRADHLLLRNYYQNCMKIQRKTTFDEVVAQMSLSAEQVSRLGFALASVVRQSELDGDDKSTFENIGTREDSSDAKIVVDELMEKANLHPLEKAALLASVENEWGGRAAVAREMVNEKTGQPYSRMAITKAYRRAVEKIRAVKHTAPLSFAVA